MEAMQHESVNKLWTGDNGGILRCWDVLLASLRSHLDCLIVWFFGCVFFSCSLEISTSFSTFRCFLTGECQWERSCLWLQQCGAPISPCIHWIRWLSTHQPFEQFTHWGQSAGWLSGLALWPEPGVMVWFQVAGWNLLVFSWSCWWKAFGNSFQKVCSHSSGMGFIDTKAGAVCVSDAQSRWLRLSCVLD